MGAEAREWEARLGALRRGHQSEDEKFARESRQRVVELNELESKVVEARSSLEAGRAELHTVAGVVEEKAAAIEKADAVAACLERRAEEAGAQVKDLEAARERASREGEATRRQQAEELSRWKEAMADRRREFEGISKLVEGKAASLGDLQQQVRRCRRGRSMTRRGRRRKRGTKKRKGRRRNERGGRRKEREEDEEDGEDEDTEDREKGLLLCGLAASMPHWVCRAFVVCCLLV